MVRRGEKQGLDGVGGGGWGVGGGGWGLDGVGGGGWGLDGVGGGGWGAVCTAVQGSGAVLSAQAMPYGYSGWTRQMVHAQGPCRSWGFRRAADTGTTSKLWPCLKARHATIIPVRICSLRYLADLVSGAVRHAVPLAGDVVLHDGTYLMAYYRQFLGFTDSSCRGSPALQRVTAT